MNEGLKAAAFEAIRIFASSFSFSPGRDLRCSRVTPVRTTR